jgi:glycosyltransferase involved in cell wall biosynthesis
MTSPLVTIGIPTYNRADAYLRQTLESALAQTYPNLEIIVSDNCSTDDTKALVEGYSDPRVRYFRQERNIAPNDNFNFALTMAKGEYFLMLHDDDMADGDLIEACMKAINNDTSVGVIRFGARIIDGEGRKLYEMGNQVGGLSTADFFLGWFGNKTATYPCTKLFNTNELRKIGGFKSRHNLFQDVVAEVRLAASLGRADLAEPKVSFRKHSGQETFSAKIRNWCEDSLDLLDLMCKLAPEKSDVIRAKGMRFFAGINYGRASAVKAPIQRLRAFLEVFRMFGYRYPPRPMTLIRGTAVHEALRHLKRVVRPERMVS